MIERFIYTALTDGIADLVKNVDRLDRIFGLYQGLEQDEVDKIKEYFADHAPTVVHNYAREDHKFPLYAIVLKDESTQQHFLGDFAGLLTPQDAIMDYNDVDIDGGELLSTFYRHSYNILVYAKHPDVCVWYYHLAKYFMERSHDFLVGKGLFDMDMGGADVAPDPRYIPSFLFTRVLRFSCQREFQLVADPIPRGRKLDGAYIDGGDTPGTPVAAVNENVSVYNTEES
jgi:hypothetical protein